MRVGSIIVIRKPRKVELKGWNNIWTPAMSALVGTSRVVLLLNSNSVRLHDTNYTWPLCACVPATRKVVCFVEEDVEL